MIVAGPVSAQEIEFGKVTKDELTEKEYPLDSDAEAAVLYKYRNTFYMSGAANSLVTKIHKRIKIYKKDGFNQATEEINLFNSRGGDESVSRIKAFTYNLENGKVVKTELDKEQIFESDLSYNYKQVKFTMPNIKEGSVIEFEYKITSPFIWNLDDFRFQEEIPVKKISAQIRTPKGFNFKQTHRGYLNFHPKVSKTRDARVGMDVVVYSYDLSNVPALKEEPYVDNMSNYRAGVMFELVSIQIPGVIDRHYSQTWGDVAKNIGNSSEYKKELDKTKSFGDIIDPLLAGQTDELKKTKLILKYVKENTEWNGVDGKYFQHGIKKVLKEKKGNVADINLTLVAMLRYAGIKANPIVLSTKDNSIPFFPTLERLNYVIAHARINNKDYYIDASHEFSDINVLPIKDYNWGGLMVDNPNEVWKHISTIEPIVSANIHAIKASIEADGTAVGTYQSRRTNHSAMQFRTEVKDKDLSEQIEQREKAYQGIEIDEYTLKNEKTYEGSVSESFSYNYEKGLERIADKMYIQPLLFLKMEENPFKQEKREFPVDFGFPVNTKQIVELSIPEGYEVESLPKGVVMDMPDGMGRYKYVIKSTGDRIQLSTTFEINKAIIPAFNYKILKEYFNQVITKQAEQIVLSKITSDETTSSSEKR